MLHVVSLLLFASSLSPQAAPGVASAPGLHGAGSTAVADSVFYLVSGSLPCEAFDPIMESLVRRPEVREFIGTDCRGGEMDMVVEFEFDSEYELMQWQVRKETRDLLAPVFRELHPLRLKIRAPPRDPSAQKCNRGCGQAAGAAASDG